MWLDLYQQVDATWPVTLCLNLITYNISPGITQRSDQCIDTWLNVWSSISTTKLLVACFSHVYWDSSLRATAGCFLTLLNSFTEFQPKLQMTHDCFDIIHGSFKRVCVCMVEGLNMYTVCKCKNFKKGSSSNKIYIHIHFIRILGNPKALKNYLL